MGWRREHEHTIHRYLVKKRVLGEVPHWTPTTTFTTTTGAATAMDVTVDEISQWHDLLVPPLGHVVGTHLHRDRSPPRHALQVGEVLPGAA